SPPRQPSPSRPPCPAPAWSLAPTPRPTATFRSAPGPASPCSPPTPWPPWAQPRGSSAAETHERRVALQDEPYERRLPRQLVDQSLRTAPATRDATTASRHPEMVRSEARSRAGRSA